jgi:FKBP-type peptidyl-prolyl cis-trans isomerase
MELTMARRLASSLLTSVILLTGCSGNESSTAPIGDHRPLPAPSASVSRQPIPAVVHTDAVLPTVTGAVGRRADIKLPNANPSGRFVISTLMKGRGRTAEENDVVVVHYTAKSWKSGKSLPGTYDNAGAPKVFAVGRRAVIPALDRAVQGQRVGSRVLVVAPPAAAYGTTGNPGLDVSATDTVVFVVDVAKVIAADSVVTGRQRTVPENLPQVQAGGSAGTIAVPDTAPPKRLVSRNLIDGSGATVKAGQTVVLQYSLAVWKASRGKDEAELIDSTWSQHGPISVVIGRGNVLEGWDKGLVGTKVGSRVLLVVPPDLGYGTQSLKGIPAYSTLVFVFDVLAAA